MDKIKNYIHELLTHNPHYCALITCLLGLLLLLGCIYDSDFLFGKPNSGDYNLKNIDGLVNFFGRGPARLIVGVPSFALMIGSLIAFYLGATQ